MQFVCGNDPDSTWYHMFRRDILRFGKKFVSLMLELIKSEIVQPVELKDLNVRNLSDFKISDQESRIYNLYSLT